MFTRQKAEFQENSATPQPIETAIVTHGVKYHKLLRTAIPLLASLLPTSEISYGMLKTNLEGSDSHVQSVTDIVYIKRGHCQ
jgi:hypothetical protein